MVIGATYIDERRCDIFVERIPNVDCTRSASLGAVMARKSRGVSAEHLSKIWHISHSDAARTLDVTAQLLHCNPGTALSRNAGTDDRAVRYERLKSKFFTDTLFATKMAKSLRGNTCSQLYVSDKGFVLVYPMQTQSEYILLLLLQRM
jgi:hypothetical protein